MTPEERHVHLSWKLLEYKLMYYRADLVHPDWREELTVPDSVYDRSEEPTACNMVGFDVTIPSGRLVLDKYSKPKPKQRRKTS